MCPSPCVRHLTWASVRHAPLLCPVLHCSLSPGRWAAALGLLAVTGFLLSSDLVSNKIIHFDLLHEDVSLQYFIPALS